MKSPSEINVLIACEESQAVCVEFRKLGFNAFSCDIQECSGGHPEWHYQKDVFEVIDSGQWDCMIAFPPCTHLAVSGAAWFEQKRKDGRQQEGIDFFLAIANAPIKHIAVENPVGIMSKNFRKPDQIIQPYYFGDEFQKTTCLWLKNIPHLYHNESPSLFDEQVTHVGAGEFYVYPDGKKTGTKWMMDAVGKNGKKLGYASEEIKKLRSKTFLGIAKAMATQWGEYLLKTNHHR